MNSFWHKKKFVNKTVKNEIIKLVCVTNLK